MEEFEDLKNEINFYENVLTEVDKQWEKSYGKGEYCHKQSFSWGFQEGVDWLIKEMGLTWENLNKKTERNEKNKENNEGN